MLQSCVCPSRNTKLWICMEYCGGGSLQDMYHGLYCAHINVKYSYRRSCITKTKFFVLTVTHFNQTIKMCSWANHIISHPYFKVADHKRASAFLGSHPQIVRSQVDSREQNSTLRAELSVRACGTCSARQATTLIHVVAAVCARCLGLHTQVSLLTQCFQCARTFYGASCKSMYLRVWKNSICLWAHEQDRFQSLC